MKKNRKRLRAIVLIVIVTAVFTAFVFGLNETAEVYARTDATNTVTTVINSAVAGYLESEHIDYGSICDFSFDGQGRIAAVRVDSARVNIIRSGISMEILRMLDELGRKEFSVPLGNIFRSSLFSGRGPGIKVKIVPLGSIASETINTFTPAGINQTRHEISLSVSVSVNILAPFSSAGVTMNVRIPIAETIILGDVPNAYIDAFGNDVFEFTNRNS